MGVKQKLRRGLTMKVPLDPRTMRIGLTHNFLKCGHVFLDEVHITVYKESNPTRPKAPGDFLDGL